MARKLRPCGTRAAYQRHLYNKEEPCEACKAANVVRVMSAPSGGGKGPREIDPHNYWITQADKALEANPPVIVWRFDPVRRIQVAVEIHDPHTERPQSLERRRLQTKYYEQKKAAS
jgi:hypothetical protein